MKRNWHWTQIDTIRTHYPHRTAYQIGAILGLPEGVIYRKAIQMKLKKAPGYYQSDAYKRCMSKEGKGCFKPGQIPPNKGKTMSDEVRAKCSVSWFKKGNEPHNTKHDGYERISKDGYRERRVSKGRFKLVHRIVWEEANGAIPDGFAVVFRDSNKLNCALENLELISREQLMLRNTIHNYPEDIKDVIRVISKLNKTIRNHGEKQDQ